MKPILEIQNISKKFRIDHEKQPYLSLRDRLSNLMHSTATKEDFWALKDVSFEVMPGDTVGVIGKNGAGKSTLLKILSKITPPTSGKIISRGRIASLLEVGTGFHPELSGRENVFLNGSILGMKRAEILSKFDEIVEFAGVERFIDTPLKHYSSGMQLRLAFAVAAFLQNEILIIDEVLAVGDAEFQKKCLGKMEDVSKSGRTVLFVSHQLGAVSHLCRKSILLSGGKIEKEGLTDTIIQSYLKPTENKSENEFITQKTNGDFIILTASTTDIHNTKKSSFAFNEHIQMLLSIAINKKINDELISLALLDKYGNRVFTTLHSIDSEKVVNGIYNVKVTLPAQIIAPNFYSFHFAVCRADGTIFDQYDEQCRINVIDSGSQMALFEGRDYGNIIINCTWN